MKFFITSYTKTMLLLALLCIGFTTGCNISKIPAKYRNQTQRVLLIGNSLSTSNDLPLLLFQEASKLGIDLDITSVCKPNYCIMDHWEEGFIKFQVQQYKPDFILLQQGPSSQQDGFDMLVNDAAVYADLCKQKGIQLAYFMVWPSRDRYGYFDKVIHNYRTGAEKNNAILCPVGEVWKRDMDKTKRFEYYGNDGFHPSLKGSKKAAEVIINSLFAQGSK